MSVWPEVSEYLPRPTIEIRPKLFPRGPDAALETSDVRSVGYAVDQAFYTPPSGAQLTAPCRALAICNVNDPAAALLAASWHLYRAGSGQQSISMVDRVAHAFAAVDVLSEPTDPGLKAGQKLLVGKERLAVLTSSEEVRVALAEIGLDDTDLETYGQGVRSLRNAAQHAREGVRAALGVPTGAASGLGFTTEFAEIAYGLGTTLARYLWSRMLLTNFSATAWEAAFSGPLSPPRRP